MTGQRNKTRRNKSGAPVIMDPRARPVGIIEFNERTEPSDLLSTAKAAKIASATAVKQEKDEEKVSVGSGVDTTLDTSLARQVHMLASKIDDLSAERAKDRELLAVATTKIDKLLVENRRVYEALDQVLATILTDKRGTPSGDKEAEPETTSTRFVPSSRWSEEAYEASEDASGEDDPIGELLDSSRAARAEKKAVPPVLAAKVIPQAEIVAARKEKQPVAGPSHSFKTGRGGKVPVATRSASPSEWSD
nr:ORF1 protein [Armillaria gallica negative stranded RNA virus 1]